MQGRPSRNARIDPGTEGAPGPAGDPLLSIGELAAATGASRRSLRHYGACGLLAESRTGSGQRRYDPDAVDTVQVIRTLLDAGLNLAAISEVLPCASLPREQQTGLLRDRLGERLRALDEEADRLKQTRQHLVGLIERYSSRRSKELSSN